MFLEIWAYCSPRWRGGARGGSGGCAALLRNVFFGVILTQNLTRAFPGCFPSENTRKLPRVFNPRKSEKSGPKSVTTKNPHFWPKKGLFWGFWPKTRTLRRLPRPLKIKSAYLGAICFWLEV